MFLVTGSKGYIGSHMTWELKNRGYDVYELKSDIRDFDKLQDEIGGHRFECVFHFAGLISVGESVLNIKKYYDTNVLGTINLLEVLSQNKCTDKFVFSSSAAAGNPNSPYGSTKKIGEMILADYERSFGIKYCALRYFNAAGANTTAGLYENHEPETHIIPLVLKALINNTQFNIFGNDFDTKDGTCVRDYIHVSDLVNAHILSYEYLKTNKSNIFDLGTGIGTSNKEIVERIEKITNKNINVQYKDRRPGDPAMLIADPLKANALLGWNPVKTVDDILNSAYESLKDKL